MHIIMDAIKATKDPAIRHTGVAQLQIQEYIRDQCGFGGDKPLFLAKVHQGRTLPRDSAQQG